MSAKKESEPSYWSIYAAINKHRFSKSREFSDKKTGKKYNYSLVNHKKTGNKLFLSIFSGLLWMSFPFFIILLALICGVYNPIYFLWAALIIIAYHFAGMYYIIRGGYLEIQEVKKKGFFSR